MHLEHHALGREPHRLVHRRIIPDVAGHRVHRTIATRAPEKLVERERGGGGDAIGSACDLRQWEIKDDRFGIDERGERIVIPGRVDFGHVGKVEGCLLEADEIAQQFEQIEQRIDVIVCLILGSHLGVAALLRGRRDMTIADIHAGVDGEAAKVGKAEGLCGDVDEAHWLPKAERKPRANTAKAHRDFGIGRVWLISGPEVEAPDREREEAIPADIGDGVGKMAMTRG